MTAVTFGPGLAEVDAGKWRSLKSSLVVAADGKASRVRQAANIDMVGWTYDQMAIVATVDHEKPHNGCAEEHFRPPGPFAILPLPGNRSSLVWVETKADAERLLASSDDGFLSELCGALRRASWRDQDCQRPPRLSAGALRGAGICGTAAGTDRRCGACHSPLAGLGFNLGLRDVAALAECVSDAVALGLDIGGADVLERYAAWRRFDTVATAAAMDGMNRLFGNDNPLLRSAARCGADGGQSHGPAEAGLHARGRRGDRRAT